MSMSGSEREEGVEWKGVERQTYCLAACHVCNCGTFVAGRNWKKGLRVKQLAGGKAIILKPRIIPINSINLHHINVAQKVTFKKQI